MLQLFSFLTSVLALSGFLTEVNYSHMFIVNLYTSSAVSLNQGCVAIFSVIYLKASGISGNILFFTVYHSRVNIHFQLSPYSCSYFKSAFLIFHI